MASAAAAPAQHRTYVQQVSALIETLYDGLAPRGKVHGVAGRGTGATEFAWWPYAPHDILTPALIKELRYEVPPDVRLCAATLDEPGARLRDTRVVWAEVPLPPTFDSKTSRGWYVPQDVETAAFEKVEAFPLVPSIINDQGWSVFVGYLLTEPAALDSPAVLHRVEAVQRGLAERLGGITEDLTHALPRRSARQLHEVVPVATVAGWSPARRALRVPASRNHDHGNSDGARVVLKLLRESQRYTLEEIETALKAGAAAGGRKR
jgi:hypothetical protein